MKLCCPLKSVYVFSFFIHENEEVCLFSLFRHQHKKGVNEDLSLLINLLPQKLHDAPSILWSGGLFCFTLLHYVMK